MPQNVFPWRGAGGDWYITVSSLSKSWCISIGQSKYVCKTDDNKFCSRRLSIAWVCYERCTHLFALRKAKRSQEAADPEVNPDIGVQLDQ
jgi:hypothetical protein